MCEVDLASLDVQKIVRKVFRHVILYPMLALSDRRKDHNMRLYHYLASESSPTALNGVCSL